MIAQLSEGLRLRGAPLKFARVMRDAIESHRILLTDCIILHRNISVDTVAIFGSPNDNGFGGLLDLDLAAIVDNDDVQQRSGLQVLTGTIEFIAIELLLCVMTGVNNVEHGSRHDIESFFWILLYVCIRNRPGYTSWISPGVLGWFVGGLGSNEIYGAKTTISLKNASKLFEFSARFKSLKPLAGDSHGLLFPLKEQDDPALWDAGTKRSTTRYTPSRRDNEVPSGLS